MRSSSSVSSGSGRRRIPAANSSRLDVFVAPPDPEGRVHDFSLVLGIGAQA
jgi:hypothetical protein